MVPKIQTVEGLNKQQETKETIGFVWLYIKNSICEFRLILLILHIICASIIDCIFNTYLRFKRMHVLYFHISDMKFAVFSLNVDTFNRNTHLEYDFEKNDNKQSKQNK